MKMTIDFTEKELNQWIYKLEEGIKNFTIDTDEDKEDLQMIKNLLKQLIMKVKNEKI